MNTYRWLSACKLLLGGFFLASCTPHTEDAVYVLPDTFRGNAAVVFDQSAGTPVEYSHEHRVYRIPRNGVLRTQFKPDHGGYAALKFCYASRFKGVDSTPNTAYLPYVSESSWSTIDLADTTIVCFNRSAATQGKVRGEVFSISSIRQADSVFEQREALLEQVLLPFSALNSLKVPARSRYLSGGHTAP